MNIRLKHTFIFLVGSIICTWFYYSLIIMLKLSPYQGSGVIFLFLGGCAPSVLGFSMAMISYEKPDRRDFLNRLYNVKVIKPVWWGICLFLMPALIAVSIVINVLFGGTIPEMNMVKSIIENPLLFFPCFILSFMSGPFSEEMGWRGFALGPLLERFGFVKGSTIIGLIWAIWHLPLYFIPETWYGKMGFQLAGFWSFIIMSIGLSMIMSLVYINTKGSILAAMFVHLSNNFSTQLIAGSAGPGYAPAIEFTRSLLILIVGIAACIYMVRTKKVMQPTIPVSRIKKSEEHLLV